ncbi:MAG: MATE family efflux transporter [Pseudomonadota bacterium]|nr:MATE family efflux transporter [Pseudomonadota bacterium]
MTDGGLLRPLLRLALPNIAATLIQAAMSFIEAWRLGALGSVSLAAVALVFPLFVLSNMWSAGAIGGAVSGAAARARGAGDRVRSAAVLRAAVVIGCVGGAVVGGLVVSLAVPMFTLAGGQGAVLRDAVAYGQTLFAGIVIIWLFNMTAAVSRGSGDMRTPFIAIVLAAATYWVTSAPLIDGFGTVGSAMALLVGFGGGLAVMVAAILFGFTPVPLVWGGVPWAVIGPILRNGLLAASQSVATILAAMLATAYVARLGDAALAGYGIGVRLELLLVPVVFGIGGAAIAVTGAHVGGGRRALAIRGAWLAAFMAAALVGVIGVLTALWPELWRGWFTDIPAVAAVTDHYLRVVGPFYGFFGLGLCLYFASQGLNTLFWPVFGTFLRLAVVAAGVGALSLQGAPNLSHLLMVVAAGILTYGGVIAAGLHWRAWRRPS